MEQVHAPLSNHDQLNSTPPQKEERCAFTGTGDGYAKVFFVNLAFNILTFGFYTPWAKVRRLKYFHHHTVLAGSPFEYTADPWPIFKGRLIVVGLAIVFSLFSAVPILNVLLYVALVAIVPRLLLQTYRFRARYSEYRGLKFHFNGTTWEVFLYSMLYRFLAVLPFGLLVPAARAAERRYLMGELQFGTSHFQARTTAGDFWRVYLISMALGLLAFVPVSAIFFARMLAGSFFESASDESEALLLAVFGVLFYIGLLSVVNPVFHTLVARATWDGATVGDATITYNPETLATIRIALGNAALTILTLSLAHPWCVVRLLKYKMSCLSVTSAAGLESFVGVRREEVRALGDQAADVLDMDLDFGF